MDAAQLRRRAASVLFVLVVAMTVITLEPRSFTGSGGRSGSTAPDTPKPSAIEPDSEIGNGGGDRPFETTSAAPGAVTSPPMTQQPSSSSSAATTPAVRPPEERPFWWEEYEGGNASAYPAYLEPIRETPADAELRKTYETARKTMPLAEYAVWVAESPDPLPGWLPTRARAIDCEGREFYSGHFSIPPQNTVAEVPNKTQDWATVIPGKKSTYVFKSEATYREDLINSRFAITRRRYGWATNRNLEIMAAGSIPFFCGVHKIPPTGTLDSQPKTTAYVAAVHMPGVAALCDPHKKAVGHPLLAARGYNDTRRLLLAQKLLRYTQRYLTTEQHALYVLSASSVRELPKRVLVLWASHYTIMLTGVINGLRRLGVEVTDVPRRAEVYEGPGCDEAKAKTYAKGWFFFCRTPESANVTRDEGTVAERIRSRYWDVVIISITDTLTYYMKDPYRDVPFYRAILEAYPRRRVLTLNDADLIRPMTADVAQRMMHADTVYFKRETHGCREDWRGY